MDERKVWILETKEGDGTAVFFDKPVPVGLAWKIWKASDKYNES